MWSLMGPVFTLGVEPAARCQYSCRFDLGAYQWQISAPSNVHIPEMWQMISRTTVKIPQMMKIHDLLNKITQDIM